MFGTIMHYRAKPGHEAQLRALDEEWDRAIRPTIPGLVVGIFGRPAGRSGELVGVVVMQDEATYRKLAARPEQDAWYRRMVEHLEAEPTWQDVVWDELRFASGRTEEA